MSSHHPACILHHILPETTKVIINPKLLDKAEGKREAKKFLALNINAVHFMINIPTI